MKTEEMMEISEKLIKGLAKEIQDILHKFEGEPINGLIGFMECFLASTVGTLSSITAELITEDSSKAPKLANQITMNTINILMDYVMKKMISTTTESLFMDKELKEGKSVVLH